MSKKKINIYNLYFYEYIVYFYDARTSIFFNLWHTHTYDNSLYSLQHVRMILQFLNFQYNIHISTD